MKIECIGGGPAGLYFAILMKKQNPAHDITVYERNKAGDTFGWGVVFSDETVGAFINADPETGKAITSSFAHWDDIDVHFKGRCIRSGGHGFAGIGRHKLLNILQDRCRELGVKLDFEREVNSATEFDADLIIAADGLNSKVRNEFKSVFKPQVEVRANKFIWLGTKKLFDAFTFIFQETEWGWFQVHAYRFNEDTSTFIVETREESWKAAGIDAMSQEDGIKFCEDLFAPWLDGHRLVSNASHLRGSAVWINFPRVHNKTWVKDNVVLMGDAAHTAHFSIGSGTKLAMEDAISLACHFDRAPDAPISQVLRAYEDERKVDVLRIQSAARNSTEWFENVARYTHLEPEQFNYSLLTRSQRLSHENLRLRDPAYLEGMEQWFAARAIGHKAKKPIPPMFTPFKLRGMELANRVVMSPMAMYSAKNGMPGDFHLTHLGSRALGGTGLIYTEMTCVSADARITTGCTGIWNDSQMRAWKRITAFVHRNSSAKICMQLGHAGPKGSTNIPWLGSDEAKMPKGNWKLIAPSPLAWNGKCVKPRAMTKKDMAKVTADFVAAAKRAAKAGFDMIELHAAHGYLLSAFISPLSNQRKDAYGGSLENRMRFPLEVVDAVRAAWPRNKPMSVRISATDWHAKGNAGDEAVEIGRMLKAHGVDIVDVSAGQTTPKARPVYGRMFQTPFSDRVRNEAGIATIAVGNITEADQVNSILAAGRADLVALARPHLSDPYWTLHAAAETHYDEASWPDQYSAGKAQYLRTRERAEQMAMEI